MLAADGTNTSLVIEGGIWRGMFRAACIGLFERL